MSEQAQTKTAQQEMIEALLQIGERLKERFGDAIKEVWAHNSEVTVVADREQVVEVCRFLKEDPKARFEMLVDLTCVDWLEKGKKPRFDVVYHLLSLTHRQRMRVKVGVPEEDCRVPTMTQVWKNANWFEREVHDMFGIVFEGHPDLRRLILPDDFEGHPLRKEFPTRGRPGAFALKPEERFEQW